MLTSAVAEAAVVVIALNQAAVVVADKGVHAASGRAAAESLKAAIVAAIHRVKAHGHLLSGYGALALILEVSADMGTEKLFEENTRLNRLADRPATRK